MIACDNGTSPTSATTTTSTSTTTTSTSTTSTTYPTPYVLVKAKFGDNPLYWKYEEFSIAWEPKKPYWELYLHVPAEGCRVEILTKAKVDTFINKGSTNNPCIGYPRYQFEITKQNGTTFEGWQIYFRNQGIQGYRIDNGEESVVKWENLEYFMIIRE